MECAAHRRQLERLGEPLEQFAADAALERLDLMRQRGLGHEEPLSGTREGALLHDREQVFQLAQSHARSLCHAVPIRL
jgi:hypothetical protein